VKPEPLSQRATIWLVGCGNMGGAMLRGWLADGIDPSLITVIDPGLPSLAEGVRLVADPPSDSPAPDVVLLGIKPQSLDVVTPKLAPHLGPNTLLLSILAGVEVSALQARFPTPKHVVRVMPNMPASIGEGVTALCTASDQPDIRELAAQLMRPLGGIEWIDREALFDAVTALSGCGPGFVLRFIDAMAAAGTTLGLPADQAMRLAQATVRGTAVLAERSTETPTQIANRVASPGGSTREGLDVLDADNALNRLILATLKASADRNAAMAAAARG
jgi:pyrroline-5-carboxylate reductase